MNQQKPQTQPSADIPPQQGVGSVTNLDRKRTRPIPGVKAGWSFREGDRAIVHRVAAGAPTLVVGYVPPIRGRVTYRDGDGRHTRIAVLMETEEGLRIVQAAQVHDGSWADVCGWPRPVGREEQQAFAKVISEEWAAAPEVPSIPVKKKDGTLVLPDAESQDLGYKRLGDPDEDAALQAWRTIARKAMQAPRTTLALGGFFSGPLASSLQSVPANIMALIGGGQKGKSSAQKVQAAEVGDPDPAYKVFGPLSTTANAFPEMLLEARYLPMGREEISAGGMNLAQITAMVSRIISGGRRDRMDSSGTIRASVGVWHSVCSLSCNEGLLRPGQPESFASRVIELREPFFASAGDADEAVRLADQYHGWPLVWADTEGMFTGERIKGWRDLHAQTVARLTTSTGGIPLTLARILGCWVVGSYMLGELLGLPEMGEVAFEDARAELPRVVGDAEENNVSPGQRVWQLIAGALAMHPAMWVKSSDLTGAALEFTPRDVLGYTYTHADKDTGRERAEVHVYGEALKRLAEEKGVNLHTGLGELRRRGILRVTQARGFKSKAPSKLLREAVQDMVYMVCPGLARDAWDDQEQAVVHGVVPVPADESAVTRSEKAALERAARIDKSQVETKVVASRRHDVAASSGEAPALVVPPKPTAVPFVSYPEPVPQVTDQEWADLEERAGANWRTRDALRLGVLGADGLYLPNCEPVRGVRRPTSVNDVPELMAAYGLKTLYLANDMLDVLELPAFDPRKVGGPQAPAACEWGVPGEAIAKMQPASGVSCWMTLTTPDGGRLNLAIPAYESRFDKLGLPGRGGFGGAESAAVMLDALMVYLLSTRHGTADRPRVIPFYLGPNKTAEDFAGGLDRDDVVSPMVRAMAKHDDHQGDGPAKFQRWSGPLAEPLSARTMVSPQWARVPNLAEEQETYLHKFDRVAAWLPAFNSVQLGIGDPTHYPAGRAYDPLKAGAWRIASLPPVTGGRFEGLPALVFKEASEGGYWLMNPDLDLLIELFDGWRPDVLEAHVWEVSKRALTGMYKKLLTMRRYVLRCQEEGRPGARWVKGIHGRLYQSFRGYLGRNDPKHDHETGDVYERDIYWRPDWAKAIMALANANTFRALYKYAQEDGRYPLSLYIDAATYTSDRAEPDQARPAGMRLGNTSGTWSSEGVIPLADVVHRLKTSDDPEGDNAHTVMREYLAEQKKQEG